MFLQPQARGNLMRHPKKKPHMSKNSGVKQVIEDPDVVPPNTHTSSRGASLFISEDTDAVIKMTIKIPKPCHEKCFTDSSC